MLLFSHYSISFLLFFNLFELRQLAATLLVHFGRCYTLSRTIFGTLLEGIIFPILLIRIFFNRLRFHDLSFDFLSRTQRELNRVVQFNLEGMTLIPTLGEKLFGWYLSHLYRLVNVITEFWCVDF